MLKLTVVLPTYNRLFQLKSVLSGFEKQTYPLDQFEIIVVSDGSTDGTDEYLQNLQTPLLLKILRQQNGGAAAARNTGIAHARSDLIMFIDDDVVPSSELINEHMRMHESDGEEIVVIGPMLTPPDYEMKPWVAWEQAMLYKQYHALQVGEYEPTARQFYTGNTSLKRICLQASGGFDVDFLRAEDVELAYRLSDQGLKFVFAPDAIGYHYANRSFESWFAIPYDYGKNDVIFAREKGQSWLLPFTFQSFLGRNPFIILLTRVLLDRTWLSKLGVDVFRFVAWFGCLIHVKPFPRLAYSFIFNLQYYQGVSDELGGRSRFFDGVKKIRSGSNGSKNE